MSRQLGGYTQRFFQQYYEVEGKRGDGIVNLWRNSKKKKIFNKWKETVKKFNSPWNNFAFGCSSFGQKKNPYFGFSTFFIDGENPAEKRDEPTLFAKRHILFLHPPHMIDPAGVSFSISHHALKRIFQRTITNAEADFSHAFSVVVNEMKYVSVMSSIFRMLIPQVRNSAVKFLIPSPAGIFLGKHHLWDDNALTSITTFVSDKQMHEEQDDLKDLLINKLLPWSDHHVRYLSDLATEGIGDQLDHYETGHALCSLAYDLQHEIKEMLEYCFSASSVGQSKDEYFDAFDKNVKGWLPATAMEKDVQRYIELLKESGSENVAKTFRREFRPRNDNHE